MDSPPFGGWSTGERNSRRLGRFAAVGEDLSDGARLMTKDFREFMVKAGNDLVTPRPEYSFWAWVRATAGASAPPRWLEALQAGCGPPVGLDATSEKLLRSWRLNC